MPDTPALTVGRNRDRVRLWDGQYGLIWDSATATTPAYQHINTWLNATIDHPDGTRWTGQFYRCPAGIKRETYPSHKYLKHMLVWPMLDTHE